MLSPSALASRVPPRFERRCGRVVALLDSVVARATTQWLLLHYLHSSLALALRFDHLRSTVLWQRVLNLHRAVIKLRIVVLFDSGACRAGLVVDQSGGAQILPVHVLVEVCVD